MPASSFMLCNTGNVPLTFDAPLLVITNHSILSPVVLGNVRRGATIDAGGDCVPHLEIVYNCISPGSTTMELRIPFHDRGSRHYIFVSFRWEFVCVGTARKDFTVQPWYTTRSTNAGAGQTTMTTTTNYSGSFSPAVRDGSSCQTNQGDAHTKPTT